MNMDENEQSRMAGEFQLAQAPSTSCENPDGFQPNVHDTLASINNNMGKMASLLEQMCQQNPKVDKPSQGERPTGTKRMSTAHESELESDSETSTIRSRGKRQRRETTDDEISIYAGDSADEEADLAELTNKGCSDRKARENKPDGQTNILDDLAKSLSDDDEANGPNIEQKLADIATKRWGKKLNPDKLKIMIEKYKRPANCPGMSCRKINPEIWRQLNSQKKRTDLQLYNLQQTVLKVTFATLDTTNALVANKSEIDHSKLVAQSVDSIAMLAHAHSQLSQLRKEQVKPAIKQEYSAICSLEDQPDSKLLFGNDLAKTLKDAKEASNISSSMKRYPTKPYNNKKPTSSWSNQNEMSNKRSQQHFLWKSQSRNTQRKKKSWQAEKK
jgi:hypothetical protein